MIYKDKLLETIVIGRRVGFDCKFLMDIVKKLEENKTLTEKQINACIRVTNAINKVNDYNQNKFKRSESRSYYYNDLTDERSHCDYYWMDYLPNSF